jgi:mannan endo-1,4-beta-mannosidase
MRRRSWSANLGVMAVAAAALLPLTGVWPDSHRREGRAHVPGMRRVATQPSSAPARPRADRVALGAYIPGATTHPALIDRYARRTGRPPAILLYYRTWRAGDSFDRRTLRAVTRRGAVPMVTWEPWRSPLGAIAAGRYDGYLRASARSARRWGRTILVRFAHEMNGDWYSWGAATNRPDAYVRAWRHVVRVFRRAHARNVRWVWAPNVDYGGLRLMRRLYPGDRWVDWVALSGFSWGGPWEWESARRIFRRSYLAIERFTRKPFMIAETAAGEVGGDKAAWIERTFGRDLRRLHRVRAVVWFNGREQWAEWDVDSTRASLHAFRAAVASPRYAGSAQDVVEAGRRGQ